MSKRLQPPRRPGHRVERSGDYEVGYGKPPVSGRFKPGQSGNPSGRRKEVGPVRELAKQYTEAAIDTLARIMQDETAPHSARVAAAEALLARGWGRPQQDIGVSIEQVSLDQLTPDLGRLWGNAGMRLESAKLLELPRVVEEEAA